jgi:amino acid adenylation domain-containing protein
MQKTALHTAAEMGELLTENPLGSYGTEHNCFSVSFAQERLWFLEQVLGNGGAYNIAGGVRLQGELQAEVLERSLQEIIRRHEILRTSFIQVDGTPVQQVHDHVPFALRKVDLYGEHGQPKSEEILRAQLAAKAASGFALREPGLFRIELWRVGEQEHVLSLVMHHIIADGWSLGVLMRELQQIYGTFIQGKPCGLGELPIQYVDYANWQRGLLGSGELEEGLEYWRKELAGAPPVVELPCDFARSQNPGYKGSVIHFRVGSDVVKKLKQLCRAEGATLYMVLLAGFEVLIARYSGEKDAVVGSPVAERPQVETEGLIGLFVNLVARRIRMESGETFRSLLRRMKQKVIAAQPYQHVPFEKVVEQVEQERGLAHMPVVQVVFSWQEGLFEQLQLSGVSAKLESVDTGTAKFDLTLTMRESREQIEGWMEYSTELFREQTIERMVESFERLLEGIVDGPQQGVMELPLLGEKEQQQLRDWNRTATGYPRERTIVELFEEVAARRAEAVALVYGEEQVSYGELERRAERIGRRLRWAGVGVEEMVGVCMERSMEMVASMVGILKAGGVYVPLDPSYPPERLRLVVEDAGVKVVLTQERLQQRLAGLPVRALCLDSESEIEEDCTAECEANDEVNDKDGVKAKVEVGPENLAYMMYTSGSSGRPKGVAVTHRGVVRLVRNTNYAQFGEQETFLQFAPPSFDASTLEIWGALLNGGRLVVYGGEEASVEELGRELQRHQVSTLWLTAGLFHLMVEERVQELRGVRQLLAGGDVLRVDAVEKVRRELPGCRLINGYGPTEGTTFSCCYAVSDGVEMGRSVPIGRPIANTQVYVLDEEMREVPVGVAGELYIGGAGLARGYWRLAELTAGKFVPDGVSGEAGGRLYRSGDRGRYLEDGNIEFLGRMDQQVKIRGYRVEPEEVESVLKQYGRVRECVVVVQGESAADKRLVAYVVGEGERQEQGRDLEIGELREYMRGRVPEYMAPSVYMILRELPLTVNGKVDRKALPQPELAGGSVYVAPRTEAEARIAAIWAEALRLERVGVEDNFFELGGHSLLASQVIARVRESFNADISIRSLFEEPTVLQMAQHVTALSSSPGDMPELVPVSRQACHIDLSAGEVSEVHIVCSE